MSYRCGSYVTFSRVPDSEKIACSLINLLKYSYRIKHMSIKKAQNVFLISGLRVHSSSVNETIQAESEYKTKVCYYRTSRKGVESAISESPYFQM